MKDPETLLLMSVQGLDARTFDVNDSPDSFTPSLQQSFPAYYTVDLLNTPPCSWDSGT